MVYDHTITQVTFTTSHATFTVTLDETRRITYAPQFLQEYIDQPFQTLLDYALRRWPHNVHWVERKVGDTYHD